VSQAAAPVSAPPRPRPWTVLASGPYRLLWSAQFLSLTGDFFTYVAMAWLVLRLSGSGAALGAVLALQAVPRAVLMLVGGAVSDRLSARTTMLVSATVRALLVGWLTVLVVLDAVQLWHLYVAAPAAAAPLLLPRRRSMRRPRQTPVRTRRPRPGRRPARARSRWRPGCS